MQVPVATVHTATSVQQFLEYLLPHADMEISGFVANWQSYSFGLAPVF